MKLKFAKFLLNVARESADLSSAKRLKVGAVIFKNNRILSTGYNGTPCGADNCCLFRVTLCKNKNTGILCCIFYRLLRRIKAQTSNLVLLQSQIKIIVRFAAEYDIL